MLFTSDGWDAGVSEKHLRLHPIHKAHNINNRCQHDELGYHGLCGGEDTHQLKDL